MIGSHDSFTYLEAKYSIFNLFSFLWRTQSLTIGEQIVKGVFYFDIRVRKVSKKDSNKYCWRVCHGLVDFDVEFNRIEDILKTFKPYKVRIILERGSTEDEELFINEVKEVSKNYENLWFSCIKKNWIVIVDLDPYIIDYSYTPILSGNTLWSNIKRIFNFIKSGNYSIKKNAELNNPTINQELISCNQLHFMDYIK